MTRPRKTRGKHTAVLVGSHRGGRTFVETLPPAAAADLARWTLIDAKEGRAAELAAMVRARFPRVRTDAQHADGRDALESLASDALIVGAVDTVESTRVLVEGQRDEQTLCFQLVGRGPGSVLLAERFGFSGVVRNPEERAAASLLLDGLSTMSAPASSRALTAAGDPMSAAMLQPMRLATTQQTIRYFVDALDGRPSSAHSLTFFTSARQYPLVVVPDRGDSFGVQKEHAIAALDHLALRRVGIVAAVAVVALEERCVYVLFVSRTHDDARRVVEVTHYRAPVQRSVSPSSPTAGYATLTD